MSESMITLYHTNDVQIGVKGQDFGSDESYARRQRVGRTMGDQIFVYDLVRIPDLTLSLQLNKLSVQERADLEWFLSEVQYARRWWRLDLPAPVRAKPVTAGCSVGGSVIKAGGFKAGEYLVQDVVRYFVRLLDPRVTFVEVFSGFYSTTLTLHSLLGFLPDNT